MKPLKFITVLMVMMSMFMLGGCGAIDWGMKNTVIAIDVYDNYEDVEELRDLYDASADRIVALQSENGLWTATEWASIKDALTKTDVLINRIDTMVKLDRQNVTREEVDETYQLTKASYLRAKKVIVEDDPTEEELANPEYMEAMREALLKLSEFDDIAVEVSTNYDKAMESEDTVDMFNVASTILESVKLSINVFDEYVAIKERYDL